MIQLDLSINPGTTDATIAKVTAALKDMESQSKRSQTAAATVVDDRGRARTAAGDYVALSGAVGQADSATKVLTDDWTRQEAVLTRLLAPAMKYRDTMREVDADIDALDQLMKEGRISAEQYANEVDRLTNSLTKVKPAAQAAGDAPAPGAADNGSGSGAGAEALQLLGSAAGPATGALAAFATGAGSAVAATIALATAAVALAAALIHIGDQYLELTNRVARYATATHSANDIVDEQLVVAGKLHASLTDTVDLFARVREGTDELGLSIQESSRLSEDFAEAAKLSGKGMGEAAGMAQKMSYWMESGTIPMRDMKAVFRELPALADVWSESLGKSRVQMMKMATDGTLNVTQLVDATLKMSSVLDTGMTKRVETASEAWQHLKDQVSVAIGKFVETSNIIPKIVAAIEKLGLVVQAMLPKLVEMGQVLAFTFDKLGLDIGGNENYESLLKMQTQLEATKTAQLALNAAARDAAFDPGAAKAVDYFKSVGDSASAAAVKVTTLQAALVAMSSGTVNAGQPGKDFLAQRAASGTDLLGQKTTYQDSMTDSVGNAKAYDAQLARYKDEQLMVTRQLQDAQLALNAVTSTGGAITADASKGLIDHKRNLVDVATALNAVKQAQDATTDSTTKSMLATEKQALLEKQQSLYDEDLAKWQAAVARATDAAMRSFVDGKTTLTQYDDAMTKIDAGAGRWSTQHKLLEELRAPFANVSHEAQVLNDLYTRGAITAAEYHRAQELIYSKLPGYAEAAKILNAAIKAANDNNGNNAAGLKPGEAYAGEAAQRSTQTAQQNAGYALQNPMEKYASYAETLKANLQEGILTNDEYARSLAKLDLEMPSHGDAFAQTIKLIQQETDDLRNNSAMHTAAIKLRQAENELHKQGRDLTIGERVEFLVANTAYEQRNALMTQEKQILSTIEGPHKALIDGTAALNDLWAHGKLTAEQYALGIDDIRIKYLSTSQEAKTFEGGVELGFDAIKHSVLDLGATIKSAMVTAFNDANTALVDLITTGTEDWSKLVTTIDKDFTKMALQGLESGLMKAAIGSPSGPGAAATAAQLSSTQSLTAAGTIASAALDTIAPAVTGTVSAFGAAASAAFALAQALASSAGTSTLASIGAASGSGLSAGVAAAAQQPLPIIPPAPPPAPAARSAAEGLTVTVRNHFEDPRAQTLRDVSSRAGAKVVINHVRRNARAIRPSSGG